jgi:hypothetical protein
MTINGIELGIANSGRLPRLGLAIRDPMLIRHLPNMWATVNHAASWSRVERWLNHRLVKTIGILSVDDLSWFAPLSELCPSIRRVSLQITCLSCLAQSLLYSFTLFTHLKGTC